MNGLDLKKILYRNPEYIEKILERLDCEKIRVSDKYVTSTRPGGKNPNGIVVKLKELLPTKMYTKNEFEAAYDKQDFIELIQYLTGSKNILEAMNYICDTCGIAGNVKIEKRVMTETQSYLNKIKRNRRQVESIDSNTPIPEDVLYDFIHNPSYDFLLDNIDIDIQEEFGVCYDILDNRVCFPIRSRDGKLISIKGRTLNQDYKEFGIPKYIYYFEHIGGELLFGEWENRQYIEESNIIYIVEAEKGVLQMASYGYRNCVSTSKNTISIKQIQRLLKMGKDIVIMYDKDCSLEHIKLECSKFKGLTNVYYIYDDEGLLDGKESPTDKGVKVLEKLIMNCKFKYKE